MKSKWRRRKRPRPAKLPIRGNSRQMWRVHILNMMLEEENIGDSGNNVSASGAGRHNTARAA